MVMESSVISQCDSAILKHNSKQNDTQNTDANTPTHNRTCHSKWGPPTVPEYCDYSVSFGNVSDADKRVFLKIYKKPPTIRPLVVAEYSKPNATNDSPISHIHVEYSRTGKCCYDPVDAVTIVAGGIGEKYVKMTIESDVILHLITLSVFMLNLKINIEKLITRNTVRLYIS
ncbi:hypothetical protein U1Q18_050998 [Sarracenia purpurea var. burkii]